MVLDGDRRIPTEVSRKSPLRILSRSSLAVMMATSDFAFKYWYWMLRRIIQSYIASVNRYVFVKCVSWFSKVVVSVSVGGHRGIVIRPRQKPASFASCLHIPAPSD